MVWTTRIVDDFDPKLTMNSKNEWADVTMMIRRMCTRDYLLVDVLFLARVDTKKISSACKQQQFFCDLTPQQQTTDCWQQSVVVHGSSDYRTNDGERYGAVNACGCVAMAAISNVGSTTTMEFASKIRVRVYRTQSSVRNCKTSKILKNNNDALITIPLAISKIRHTRFNFCPTIHQNGRVGNKNFRDLKKSKYKEYILSRWLAAFLSIYVNNHKKNNGRYILSIPLNELLLHNTILWLYSILIILFMNQVWLRNYGEQYNPP
jgi:hypothetical protein